MAFPTTAMKPRPDPEPELGPGCGLSLALLQFWFFSYCRRAFMFLMGSSGVESGVGRPDSSPSA